MSTRVDLDAVISDLDTEIASREQELDRLRSERAYAVALRTRAAVVAPAKVAEATTARSSKHARTGTSERVAEILRDAPDGMTVREVQAALAARGDDLDSEQVRSALTYLGRKKQAETLSRGFWRWGVTAASEPSIDPREDDSPAAMPHGLSVVSSSPAQQEARVAT